MLHRLKEITIHFIGIGGIGMSGIAEVLLRQGLKVTGSDIGESPVTEKLKELGAKIFLGHHKEYVPKKGVVVYSSAISETNEEMIEAKARGIATIQRAEMLAELMRLKSGLAVAGGHGKTTTTSLLATILHQCGMDPTCIIGGIVEGLGGNAKVGSSDILVVEADESDGSFLFLNPMFSVITNIDSDHLDHYGTMEELERAFIDFSNKVPFYGKTFLNAGDPNSLKIRKEIKRPVGFFGLEGESENLDYEARNINQEFSHKIEFDLYHFKKFICKVDLPLIGIHNVRNALAAICLAHQFCVSLEVIALALSKFRGVGRRLEKLGSYGNLEVIDDYAHHPTEIVATLKTLKEQRKKELIVVFEPHRYSRTEQCWGQFLHAFDYADSLYMAPIYAAGERNQSGVNTKRMIEDINKLHPKLAKEIELKNLPDLIEKNKDKDALIVLLGAGSIGKLSRKLLGEMLV